MFMKVNVFSDRAYLQVKLMNTKTQIKVGQRDGNVLLEDIKLRVGDYEVFYL